MPSSPMPGNPPGSPATLTPNPAKPAAAMWLPSLKSGLQGGECCLCCGNCQPRFGCTNAN